MKNKFNSTFQWFCVAACVLLMLAACKLPDNSDNTPPPQKWAVTVQYDEDCGTASAAPNPAEKGTKITLTAEPKSNYKFKAWKLVSGDVVIYSINTNPATFTMPGNDVTIMAEFEILADIMLDEVIYGFEQPAKKNIRVIDLGIDSQTVQNIELGASNESPFVFDEQDLNSKITVKNVQNFLVQPKAGLKAGTYTDTVIITHGNGKTAVFTMGITVKQKPVTISGLTAKDKEYDGDTGVTLTGIAKMSGIIEGDDVELNPGEASFEDKNVGEGKAVILSGFTLSGADAGNYTLPQQSGIKADILPKPILISIIRPSRTLVPFDTAVDIDLLVNWQIAGETVLLSVGTNSYGLSGSVNVDDRGGMLTIVYDGTPVEQATTVSVALDIDGNYTPYSGLAVINVSIRDGLAPDRWIPITNANLEGFQVYVNTADGLSRHYKLIEDITLNTPPEDGTNWTAIGSFGENYRPFTGSFDGSGKVINNLTNGQGMFANIGTGGVVKNTALVGGSISGTNNVGGLAGLNSGTIQNCYTTTNVIGLSYVGGLVGSNNSRGTIQNCYTTGNIISSYGDAGGVVGWNMGTVKNCFATGMISGGWSCVGGVAGSVDDGDGKELRNCVALNLMVTSSYDGSYDPKINRVVGSPPNAFYNSISNNYARSDMNVKYNWNGSAGDNKTIVSDRTSADGLSITSTQYNTASWWTTAGNWSGGAWDFTNIWQMNTNNLPKLKDAGGEQGHRLQ
jgi:hypothetical protein